MTLDQENISLKILRILNNHYDRYSDSGLEENLLEEKFDFINEKNGKTKIKKNLSELEKLGLLKHFKKDKKFYHSITEKGIKHYQSFKFFIDKNTDSFYGVVVQGNWSGNNDNHHIHYHINKGSVDQFPGQIEEFIIHYEELLKEIEETENLAVDIPSGGKILEKLSHMKTIINLDSSALGGKLKWENRIEKLIDHLEQKVKSM